MPAFKVANFISSIQRAKDLDIVPEDYEGYLKKIEETLKGYVLDLGHIEESVSKAKVRLGTMYLEPQTKALREEKKGISAFLDAYEDYATYTAFLNAWKGYEQIKDR